MTQIKTTSGIAGLDKVLSGGYLNNLPTLIKGGPGSGKTIISLFFIHEQIRANGAAILVTCDESPEQLLSHMDSFGLSGTELYRAGKLILLDFRPHVFDQISGEYELNTLLFRIVQARKRGFVQALVIDSLQDMLLGLAESKRDLELLKLFSWVREEKLTLLVTIADSTSLLNSQLIEEYAVDCVIYLQQHMHNNLMTRYLRVIKLRGASYGTNNYPFTIKDNGVSILPITDTRLNAQVSKNYLSTGIAHLDLMMAGKGYREFSTVMFTGRSGSAKTIFAASLMSAAIKAGKKGLYVSFEESPSDLIDNLKSVNIDFDYLVQSELLKIDSRRIVEMGMEEHIISIISLIDNFHINYIVLDPISAFLETCSHMEVKMLLIRFIALMKVKGVTLILTELIPDGAGEYSNLSISSMSDTWIRLRQIEHNGEFNRLINIIKSRGIKTSNQVKEFYITDEGITIEEPYIGDSQMLFGSAKKARVLLDEQQELSRKTEISSIEEQISALSNEFEAQKTILEAQFKHKHNELALKKKYVVNEVKQNQRTRDDNKRLRE